MAEKEQENPTVLLNLGDRVKIRHSGGLRGRIVELRGPLEPGGVQVYRVRVRRKPEPKYIELQIKDVQQKLQPEFDVKVWQ